MSEQTPEVIWDGFFTRFEQDLNELQTSVQAGSSGRGRVIIREKILEVMRVSRFKLDVKLQLSLIERLGKELVQCKEYGLADECFAYILNTLIPDLEMNEESARLFKVSIRATIGFQKVFANYKSEITASAYSRVAPMAVTRLLLCLQELRDILKGIFEDLPVAKEQEKMAWLILNGCKLIMRIAQPLVSLSCGKYVTETIVFASLCMEAVVNLCTCRHLKFRMKLYVTAFYSTLAAGSNDDSSRLLEKIARELNDLKDREYLDPPVPEKTEITLLQADMDLATMRAVLHFWMDPDAMASGLLNDDSGLREKFKYPAVNNDYKSKYQQVFGTLFTERVLSEYIRIHQLTSGNINEPYKRRTSAILRGFSKLAATFPIKDVEVRIAKAVSSPGDSAGHEEEKSSTVKMTDCPLSSKCLLELLVVSQFEELPEGSTDCNVADIQSKLIEYSKTKNPEKLESYGETAPALRQVAFTGVGSLLKANDETHQTELVLLDQIVTIIALSKGNNFVDQLSAIVQLVQTVDSLLYSPVMDRRRAFLQGLSMSVWRNGLYPQLQRALSDLTSESLLSLKVIAPMLVSLMKTLDLTGIEDPLLLGALSLITARILGHFRDLRGAIALLLQSIETIDEHRAARVDISLHMPVDTRDISALQRSSITTLSEARDWYHSVKRLGAHAFAGFGVFGASSQTERTDSALAELHADMIALYFRYELEYGIERKHLKHQMKSKLWTKDGHRVTPNARKHGSTHNIESTRTLISTESAAEMAAVGTVVPVGLETMIQFNEEELGGVKKIATDHLPVVTQLKAWCERNSYARAILNIELARIEKSGDKAERMLNDACRIVDEIELEEEALKTSLADLTILRKDPHLQVPLIVARTHKFIYTVPVGSKGLQEKRPVEYYRIFAKEEKNASLVTLVNDEMDGCEKRVSVQMLGIDNQLSECAVRVGNLSWGQKYVFATAAFDAKNSIVGSIGPTSVSVTAANPLPTLLLWTYIYKVAADVLSPRVKLLSAGHVCDRFFLANPNQGVTPFSVGKGSNVLVGEEPAICMLAVQKASPVILAGFVAAYLAMEEEDKSGSALSAPQHPANKGVPVGIRREEQWRMLSQLRRTATVAVIASYSQQVDLIIRCVVRGYESASKLLFVDERHLGGALQNPLIMLLVVLQSVPKRHWHELEHNLYCRLLHHVLKLSRANRSTASVVPLLNRVFDSQDKDVFNKGKQNEVSELALLQYSALERLIRKNANIYGTSGSPAITNVEAQFNEVFAALIAPPSSPPTLPWYNPNQGFLWTRARSSAIHAILENGRDAVLSGAVGAKVQLTGKPECMSDLLAVFVALIKPSKGAQEDKDAFRKTVEYLPIYDKLLAPEVLELHDKWKLGLVKPLPEQPVEPQAAPTSDAVSVPNDESTPQKNKKAFDPLEKYREVSRAEACAQLGALGEICFLRAQRYTMGAEFVGRNYHPSAQLGPEKSVDLKDRSLFVDLSTANNAPEPVVAPAPAPAPAPAKGKGAPVEPVVVELPFTKLDFMRNMGAALCLYTQAGYSAAAIGIASRLWNFIVDQWISPEEFAREFVYLHENIKLMLSSIIRSATHLVQNCGRAGSGSAYDYQSSLAELGDKDNNNRVVTIAKEGQTQSSGEDATITPYVVEEHLQNLQCFFIFMLKVEWLHKNMFNVIEFGSQIVDCYLCINQPALCKSVGEACIPIVIAAQELIIEEVEAELAAHRKSLENCEFAFEELMKKKRRKKTRTMRVEKDEDDIRHEAEMELIQKDISETESRLEFNKERLRLLKLQSKRFDTLYPTGIQLLNKVRIARNQFLQDCYAAFSSESEHEARYGDLLQENAKLTQALDEVLDQYDQVTNFLREKKDKVSLVEALREQGDLLLLFGMNSQARNIWHDGLDGLFNTMDTYKDWKPICATAIQDMYSSQDVHMLRGMITAIDILAKLSKFCAAQDWDMKTNYTRFAAELCRAPFLESYGHPVSLVGFAAYICKDLGGPTSCILSAEKANIASLSSSLEEIATIMCNNKLNVQALPVVVLLEHIHSSYTHRAEHWLRARLMRIRLLIDAHLFAQAASMLATIQYSITCIAKHSYNDLLIGSGPISATGFDTAVNGLDFYGKAPFFNNLPPNDEKNKTALQWIASLPTELETFLTTFQSKKGSETVPLFVTSVVSEAAIVCGQFLIEISFLDGKATASHNAFLVEQADKGLSIIQAVTETKIGGANSNDTSFPYPRWIKQYSACVFLKSEVLLRRRQPMEARRQLVKLLELLQANNVKSYMSVDIRSFMTYTWLQVRDKLVDIASKQYRLEDAVKQSTLAVQEASMTCNGFWIRSLLLRRAVANYKLGRLKECDSDCSTVVRLYEQAQISDISQLRCLALKCSVLREMLCGNITPGEESAAPLTDSLVLDRSVDILRTAYSIAESLSTMAGFFGADINVTFSKADSNVSKYHYLPPMLHSLTNIHLNEPELTRKYHQEVTQKNDGKPNSYLLTQSLRAGPVDSNEKEFSQSEYVNIYLKEVKALADCHAALAGALDEKRELEEALADATDISKTLAEQTSVGENALKLLRHIVFSSPHSRAMLLQLVGQARTGMSDRTPAVQLNSPEDKIVPLTTSLGISRSSAHDWYLMRRSCVQLVGHFYDQATSLGPLGGAKDARNVKPNLAKAIQFLMCGVKLGKQLRTIEKDSLRVLSADKAFSGIAPNAELAKILDSSMKCSSATVQTARSIRGVPSAPAPVDPKAKGKAPAGATTVPASTSGARDAIFMLSSVMLDFENDWLDTENRSDYCDMDSLLKTQYPSYNTLCSMAQVPNLDKVDTNVVPADSITSLWVPIKTVSNFPVDLLHANFGRYSHVAGYILLGGTTPLLKRLVMQRADIVHVRKGLLKLQRDLTNALAHATAKDSLMNECGTLFAKVLELLGACFRDGYIDERSDEDNKLVPAVICSVVTEGSNISIQVTVSSKEENAEPAVMKVPLNADVVSSLADLLCCDKDVDAIVQANTFALIKAFVG